ncbi:putative mitochondrial protein AtMg00820 [Apium graveolens]|uniref:putative mitochondrial protein AtMg00820 n=1 Tax=Apium graveolens TaxID=4045 RepID=UPI003D797ADD
MGIEEPMNFVQAAKDINWKLAMKKEKQSSEENQNWKLSELPPGKNVIGLKWIFKLKQDAEGKIVKHKARLVPKGYVQQRVVDFDEVFAPVTRPEMVHFLLALAAKNQLEVHHLDVPETKVRYFRSFD